MMVTETFLGLLLRVVAASELVRTITFVVRA